MKHSLSSSAHNINSEESILEEAAEWIMLLDSGDASPDDLQRLKKWREQSDSHQIAWKKAENVIETLQGIPSFINQSTLTQSQNISRRASLKALLAAVIIGPTTWAGYKGLPWDKWQSDAYTSIGKIKSLTLPDGSQLILNTNSSVNISFSATQRKITLLQGEILVTTHPDPHTTKRPFVVHTTQGKLEALGTEFSVRQLDDTVKIAVFKHAVKIMPSEMTQSIVIKEGQQCIFDAKTILPPSSVNKNETLWEHGMVIAKNTHLGDLLDEISRYRLGVIRYSSDVAKLKITGSFPIVDTDTCLQLLSRALPIHISQVTPWWVTVKAI